MLIIKCKAVLPGDSMVALWEDFRTMAESGVVLLPSFCELLNEVPPDTEIVVVKDTEKE